MRELIIIVGALLIVFVSFYFLRVSKDNCAAKGGVLLSSAGSYVCVEAKEIK